MKLPPVSARLRAASVLLLVAAVAQAGKKKPKDEVPPPEVAIVAPAQTLVSPFPDQLPLAQGVLPAGLAHISAQACASCHPAANAAWLDSAHAGPPPAALFAASHTVGDARCLTCHLPLVDQWASVPLAASAELSRVDNPGYDATLRAEGVTCAACHVREGAVLAARERQPDGAPHAFRSAPSLATEAGCASCHQLTLPGQSQPLYDTVGEWSRSAWAQAGVGCVDCHAGGADRAAGSHALLSPGSQGLTVIIGAESTTYSRGSEPRKVTLTLLNTGAGHSLPTGSPFVAWQLQAMLEGPPGPKGEPTTAALFTSRLGRTLAAQAPFDTASDTRIPAGGRLDLDWALTLPVELPAGQYHAVVRIQELGPQGEPRRTLHEQRLPLSVE